jgi:hypothetical protein
VEIYRENKRCRIVGRSWASLIAARVATDSRRGASWFRRRKSRGHRGLNGNVAGGAQRSIFVTQELIDVYRVDGRLFRERDPVDGAALPLEAEKCRKPLTATRPFLLSSDMVNSSGVKSSGFHLRSYVMGELRLLKLDAGGPGLISTDPRGRASTLADRSISSFSRGLGHPRFRHQLSVFAVFKMLLRTVITGFEQANQVRGYVETGVLGI